MKLSALLAAIDPVRVENRREQDIVGIACDSRQVRPGYLFVAVHGAHVDGAEYVGDALARGATAIVGERAGALAGSHVSVIVRDARVALAGLAVAFYGAPSGRMGLVGITGTNGKTTIAFMLRDILRAAGREPGLIGTVEYEIGSRSIPAQRTTPDAVTLQSMLAQMVEAGCLSAVMEVSSHALVQKRTHGIAFDVAVFTNLTRDHLDYHHTMEEYFEAKALLFDDLGTGGKTATAVVNLDDPWGRELTERISPPGGILTYGTHPEAMVCAEGSRMTQAGTRCRVRTPWGHGRMALHLLGGFNISNALAAVAAGGAMGIDLEPMLGAVSAIDHIPGRLEEIPTGLGFQVFVDYAHTDDALEHVLTTLRPITPGRLLLVFGCGGNRDATKRPAMGAVADRLADYTILTSDNPRKENPLAILEQIEGGFASSERHAVVENRRQAIEAVVSMARRDDVVLIAGKGHETFQELSNRTVPFDDRIVVREACTKRKTEHAGQEEARGRE